MPQTTCQRCQQPLQAANYEGVNVTRCGSCEAYWLSPRALTTVLLREVVEFTKTARHRALEAEAEDEERDPVVRCVVCDEFAKKSNVLGLLLIDYCPGHGVWLDKGELDRIQVLGETNEQWRDALLRMVSGKRKGEA